MTDDSPLARADLDDDPFVQFARWFDAAAPGVAGDADAAALATATRDGAPSARMVLVRGRDSRGFVFFTNHESRKGRELAVNPHAALLWYWPHVRRQVRVEGTVALADAGTSDAYWNARPVGSRLSAAASEQSRPVTDRGELETRRAALAERHHGDVPRPVHWGGFRLTPRRFEFWQSRADRLHDRFAYEPDGPGWRTTRLAP